MKTDEELVKEIMEAGYGYSKPSVLGTAAHFGAKMAGKAAYHGIKAGMNAYQNSSGVQMKNQGKLRQAVFDKLNKDFSHWAMRTSGQQVPKDETTLPAFMRDVYQYDATAEMSAAETAVSSSSTPEPAQTAPQAAPAPEKAPAGEPAEASAAAAPEAPEAKVEPSTGRRKKPDPHFRSRVTDTGPDGKKLYRHDSSGINFDEPALQEPIGPQKDKRKAAVKPAAQESIDLSKSFSEIITERAAAVENSPVAKAFFDKIARSILAHPQTAQNFLQNNVIAGSAQSPAAAPKPGNKPGATPTGKASPGQPAQAPASPLKDQLNKVLVKMGNKVDKATLDALVGKLRETPDLSGAAALVQSPAEIEAAKAMLIAVLVATEL